MLPQRGGNPSHAPRRQGSLFVGSTSIGRHIYATAAANGKRVQALTEAKNHALVLKDAALDRTASGIVNSACGCAGERCMALPVIVAEEAIADRLVELLVKKMSALRIGPAYDPASQLGPLVNAEHRQSVITWIQKGVDEGAKLVLDGRGAVVKGYEKGFYLGPTLFDHVKPGMTIGDREIFGPVLCIKRVKSFEEGLSLMNASELANGSVIYTQSGYSAREFAARTQGGMVGINVGIPVPLAVLRVHRTQELVLRRPAHHGHRRRAILHGAEERHGALVLRGGSPRGEGLQYLGRHDLDARRKK